MFAASKGNGFVAEWLGRALQKLLQRFESARNLSKDKKTSLSKVESFLFFCLAF